MTFPALDPWQYRITREAQPEATPVGDVWLETGAGLPVATLVDRTGKACGVVLGFALDLRARTIIGARLSVDAIFDAATPDPFVQSLHQSLAGRFLILLAADGLARIYPDSCSQVSCVYDYQTGCAGSTATALLDAEAYENRFDSGLYAALRVDGPGWFPAGLTAHKGVTRLLPGQYVDLQNRRIVRFRPLFEPATDVSTLAEVRDNVIALIQAQIQALVAGGKKVAVALTAGWDTRIILACARPFIKEIDVATIVGPGEFSRDSVMSRRIAREFGLNHLELMRTRATDAQRELYLRRGGHCHGDVNSWYHPSVWSIADTHVLLSGMGGEFAHGYLWRDKDSRDTTVTVEMLANRLALPALPEITANLQTYLESFPKLSSGVILDYAFLENRLAGWSSSQYCCDPTLNRYSPILCWPVLDQMQSVSAHLRPHRRLAKEIIGTCWPELGKLPYNSLGKWQDLRFKLGRLMDDPTVVMRKLREMRG